MDGASKFVKGDATAGIIITVINIIGGLIIGVWQLKMNLMTALSTYTILTVGDGLVSQIPALLISFATGLIVSRASGQDDSLSDDIKKEMFSNPTVLGVVSGLLVFLGLVPGMPTIPFCLIGAVCGYVAYNKNIEKKKKQEEAKQQEEEKKKEDLVKNKKKALKGSRESVMELLAMEPIEIEIGYRLVPLLNVEQGGDLLERISQLRRQTALEMGIILPSIRVRDNLQLPPNHYQIKLKGVPIEKGEIYPDRFLAMNASGMADDSSISGINAIEPAFGLSAIWIEEKDKENAEMASYTVVSPSAVISTHLTEIIKKNAADILSRNDVKQLIENLKKEVSEDYVKDLMTEINISDVQIVMQNLLKERISVRDLRTILETMSLQVRVSKNTDFLTEHVRQALSRTICKQNLSATGELLAITLAPDIESAIAQGMSPDGQSLTLDPTVSNILIKNMDKEIEKAIVKHSQAPVILCSAPIRMCFRRFIEKTHPQIAVMSYNELVTNIKAKSVGIIKSQLEKV